jgi:hypothetical protein
MPHHNGRKADCSITIAFSKSLRTFVSISERFVDYNNIRLTPFVFYHSILI